jgi:hypothetical protein
MDVGTVHAVVHFPLPGKSLALFPIQATGRTRSLGIPLQAWFTY